MSNKHGLDAGAQLWNCLVFGDLPWVRVGTKDGPDAKSRDVKGSSWGGEAWTWVLEPNYMLAKYIRWGKGTLCRGKRMQEKHGDETDQSSTSYSLKVKRTWEGVWRGESQALQKVWRSQKLSRAFSSRMTYLPLLLRNRTLVEDGEGGMEGRRSRGFWFGKPAERWGLFSKRGGKRDGTKGSSSDNGVQGVCGHGLCAREPRQLGIECVLLKVDRAGAGGI